jgi:hypothetical protein
VLVELTVVEQRYHAVMGVLVLAGGERVSPHGRRIRTASYRRVSGRRPANALTCGDARAAAALRVRTPVRSKMCSMCYHDCHVEQFRFRAKAPIKSRPRYDSHRSGPREFPAEVAG